MKPALTQEEWEQGFASSMRLLPDGRVEIFDVDLRQDERHATAALCLHGQEFGFTREHVKLLREEASWHNHSMEYSADPRRGKLLDNLADRIEALLPPEAP